MQTSSSLLTLPVELRRLIYTHIISESSSPPSFSCRHTEPMNCVLTRYRPVPKSESEGCSRTSESSPSRLPFWPPTNASIALLSVNRALHHEYKTFLSHNYTPRLIFSMLPKTTNEWVQSLRIDISANPLMDRHDASNTYCHVCRLNYVNELTTIEAQLFNLSIWFPSLCKLQIVRYPLGSWHFRGDRLPAIVISLTRIDKLSDLERQRCLRHRQIIEDLDPVPTDNGWCRFHTDPLGYDWIHHFHRTWRLQFVLDEVAMGILSPMYKVTKARKYNHILPEVH